MADSDQQDFEPEYDVFVSYRIPDANFKRQVVGLLRSLRYKVCDQEEMGLHPDHVDAAAEYVRKCQAVVFLINQRGMLNDENEGSFQYLEHLAFLKVRAGRKSLGAVNLALPRETGIFDNAYFDSLPPDMRKAAANIAVDDVDDLDGEWVQEFMARLSQHFIKNKLQTVSTRKAAAKKRMREQEVRQREIALAEPVAVGAAIEASPIPASGEKSPDPFNWESAEREYLRQRAPDWAHGRVQEFFAADGFGEAAPEMLRHMPERFVHLNARLRTQEAGSPDANDIRPAFDWLTGRATQHKRIVLVGEPGAGKTTTINSLAALYAIAKRPALADIYAISDPPHLLIDEVNAKFERLEDVPFPIMLRCLDVANALGQHGRARTPPTDGLCEWISSVQLKTHETAEVFRARLAGRPYCLFVDSIDEIDPSLAQQVATAIATLQSDVQELGGSLKVIYTARKAPAGKQLFGDVIEILPLTEEQMVTFVDAFSRTTAALDGLEAQRTFVRTFRRQIEDKDKRELFKAPLFLNAACHLHAEEASFDSNRITFCDDLLDHLVNCSLTETDSQRAAVLGPAIDQLLDRIAFESIRAHGGKVGQDDIKYYAFEWFEKNAAGNERYSSEDADDFVKLIVSHFLPRIGVLRFEREHVTFSHSLFREFLAARYATQHYIADAHSFIAEMSSSGFSRWRQVVVFVIALAKKHDRHRLREAVEFLQQLLAIAMASANAAIALQILGLAFDAAEEGHQVLRGPATEKFLGPGREALSRLSGVMPLKERANRIRQLSQISSRRSDAEAGRCALHEHLKAFLPDLQDWLDVTLPDVGAGAGRVLKVACQPVLVADYAAFADSETRNEEAYWRHASRANRGLVSEVISTDERAPIAPIDAWDEQQSRRGAPVVFVTWYEAVAYCHWLQDKMRNEDQLQRAGFVRLLTASEWKAIARLTAGGGAYPWGDAAPGEDDAARVNWREADIDMPSATGVFAPLENRLYDFGSNVKSWSLPEGVSWPPPERFSGKPDVMGGSWIGSMRELRVEAARVTARSNGRSLGIGFRVCIATR